MMILRNGHNVFFPRCGLPGWVSLVRAWWLGSAQRGDMGPPSYWLTICGRAHKGRSLVLLGDVSAHVGSDRDDECPTPPIWTRLLGMCACHEFSIANIMWCPYVDSAPGHLRPQIDNWLCCCFIWSESYWVFLSFAPPEAAMKNEEATESSVKPWGTTSIQLRGDYGPLSGISGGGIGLPAILFIVGMMCCWPQLWTSWVGGQNTSKTF